MKWALLLVLALAPMAMAKRHVTIDWIFGDGAKLFVPPWMSWVNQHDLLILSPGARAFSMLEPASGKVRPVGRPLTQALGAPEAVDPQGHFALYSTSGELLILDVDKGEYVHTGVKTDSKDARFSPDGKSLSYVLDNDLYVYDIAAKKPLRLTKNGSKTLLNGTLTWVYWEEIYWHQNTAYWWSPDSKKIAYFQTDESPVPLTTFVGFEPQYPETITQVYPKAGKTNPTVRLGVVQATGGETEWVSPPPSEYEYLVGVKWTGDGRLLFGTMNRTQSLETIWLAGPSAVRLVDDRATWIKANADFDTVPGDGLLFGSGKTGCEHMYRFDLKTHLSTPVTKGPWQVDGVAFTDEKKGLVYVIADLPTHIQRQIYRARSDGTGFTRISKEHGVHSPLFSPDGAFYVDAHTASDQPLSLSLHSADGRLLKVLTQTDQRILDSVYWTPQEFTTIPARDGFRMPATIRKPQNFNPRKRYPVIMEIYGGPESPSVVDVFNPGWSPSQVYPMGGFDQMYCDAGYIVVHVDNRSSTVISKKYVTELKGDLYGASERNDFVDAARWLKKQTYIDPNRVGLSGWSGGGGNTLNCMCRSTEFKAGIAGAPYVDPAFYDTFYSELLFGLPSDNPQGYARAGVWRDAKNLHGRLLLMWGTGDDNVHPQHEQKFVDECIKAGKTLQIMIYPMRKHSFDDVAAQKHRIKTFMEFWKQNL